VSLEEDKALSRDGFTERRHPSPPPLDGDGKIDPIDGRL
jgi:hypothetical protein